MPKVIKKRAVKKKPVDENEVKSAALQAVENIKGRQKQIITGVSALVILIVLVIVYATYTSSLREEAYSIETEAYTYYYGEKSDKSMSEEDKWKKSLELFKESVGIKPSPTALFYLGNCYYNLGDYENAIKEYNNFVEKFSKAKGVLPLVYQKLATTYFKTNKDDMALETLGRLSRVENGIFKDTALVLEARYYDSAGQSEKALDKYRELSVEFPNSPWSGEAGSKLASEEAQLTEAAQENAAEITEGLEVKKEPTEKQQEEPAAK